MLFLKGPIEHGVLSGRVESIRFSGYRDLKGRMDGQTDIILLRIIDNKFHDFIKINSRINKHQQM